MVFSLVAATWVQGLPSPLIHPALSSTVSEAHRWAGQPLTAPLPRVEGRHPAGQTDPKATLDLGPSPASHKPTNTCAATQPSLQRPHLAAGSASCLVLSLLWLPSAMTPLASAQVCPPLRSVKCMPLSLLPWNPPTPLNYVTMLYSVGYFCLSDCEFPRGRDSVCYL